MKTICLPILCVALAGLCGCNFKSIHGSGVAKTETRMVGAFSKINVTGSPEVEITVGSPASLTITADDNLLPIIETKVDGDTLDIGSTESYSTSLGVKLKITVPKFEGASVTGSSEIHATGVSARDFIASVTGSGSIVLAGSADLLDGQITGSGEIKATELAAKNASVGVTGSGRVLVNASEKVDASITGSGSVRYSGNPPTVQKRITGSGQIKPR